MCRGFCEKRQKIIPPTTRKTRMDTKQAEARKAAEAAYEANKKLNENANEDSSCSRQEIVQNNLEEPAALAAANTEPSEHSTCRSAPASLAQRSRVKRRRKPATCRSVPEFRSASRRVGRPKQVTCRSTSRPKTTATSASAIQIDDDDIIVIDETETDQNNNETRSSKSPRTPALKRVNSNQSRSRITVTPKRSKTDSNPEKKQNRKAREPANIRLLKYDDTDDEKDDSDALSFSSEDSDDYQDLKARFLDYISKNRFSKQRVKEFLKDVYNSSQTAAARL